MYYEFPTYIDDKGMIPVLLDHDWMCYTNGTWTNCPYPIYKALSKQFRHNGNAKELSRFPNKRSTTYKTSTII